MIAIWVEPTVGHTFKALADVMSFTIAFTVLLYVVGCCVQITLLDKHKSALAEHLRAEKAAAAAAAEKLQEDIRLQVERLVLEHNKTAGRRLESAVAAFTTSAIDIATCSSLVYLSILFLFY